MPVKKYAYQRRSPKNMEGEAWQDVPGFEGYYQISNFGRVKALERWVERKGAKGDMLIKGMILKQNIRKKLNPYTKAYYFQPEVSLCRNARKTTIAPGRMVYCLFVKKFDPADTKLAVVARDGDNLNTRYDNLRLVEKSAVQTKAYREDKKKKPFKVVSQYHCDGTLIKTYPSVDAAAAETGITANSISEAANGRLRHISGRLWRFGGRKKTKAVKFPARNVRPVAQFTAENVPVRSFSSIKEAAQVTGFDNLGIMNAAKKRRDTYKGFMWKYIYD